MAANMIGLFETEEGCYFFKWNQGGESMANEGTKDNKKVPKYERIMAMDDDKINILILGTSGCGKSTLINSVLGENEAQQCGLDHKDAGGENGS